MVRVGITFLDGFIRSIRFCTMRISVVSILLLLCLEGVQVYSADIILKNNGYENVLVAISDSVPEDPMIIERIKAIFTKGSGYMYRSTRYRAYFRNITILVPAKWTSKREYESPSNDETFAKAALRVDKSKFGDSPYTLQYACGKQGRYIHLTPKYVINETFAREKFGPPGKTLVHEWGHFRWGLFDEYPTLTAFYVDKGELQQTRCTGIIPGKNRDKVTKGNCKIVAQTGLPDKNCLFKPDRNQKVTTASYMYMPNLQNVVDFCDNGTLDDPSILHNKKAPNKQNLLCGGRSAWEVMRESIDFKNNRNPPNANKQLDTTPTFRLVQRGNLTKVVVLFDASWSMEGPQFRMMQQMGTNYILNIVGTDSYLGIVIFAGTAITSLGMTKIESQADRERATSHIPTTNIDGFTAIGTGMQHAMNVLKSTPYGTAWARGSRVILMTDGKSYDGVPPLSLIPMINELGITFYTIGFGAAADLDIEAIARETGGQSFFASNSDLSTGLFDSMFAIADLSSGGSSSGTADGAPVSVATSSNTVEKSKEHRGKFAIDFTIGKDTTITFNYLAQSAEVEVRLEAPDGRIIDKSDTANYRVNTSSQIIQIDIPGTAMKGEWNYTVTTSHTTVVLVNVLSKPVEVGEDAEPISVKTWFGDDKVVLASGPDAQISIFGQVSRGYIPCIGFKVTAAISGRNALGQYETVNVDLQDKGYGADIEANDGIYSVEFGRSQLNVEGRHSVNILVDNPDNTGKIAMHNKASGAPIIGEPDESVTMYQAVGPIQRVAAAGELRVERPSFPNPVDVIPPSRIRDLKLLLLDTEKVEVTLSWTAVGDDVSHSINTTYDLRIGTFKEISDAFENSSKIDLKVTPKNAGDEEKHTINMADYIRSATYFFAIRAIDEVGNKGDPSNIISVSMTLPTKFSNGDGIVAIVVTPSASSPLPNVLWFLVGAVIAMIAGAGVVYYYYKKKKPPPPDQPHAV